MAMKDWNYYHDEDCVMLNGKGDWMKKERERREKEEMEERERKVLRRKDGSKQ